MSLLVLFSGLQIRLKLPLPRRKTDTFVTLFDCAAEMAAPAANAAAHKSVCAFIVKLPSRSLHCGVANPLCLVGTSAHVEETSARLDCHRRIPGLGSC